jgi:predicted dienelactone hydrolase
MPRITRLPLAVLPVALLSVLLLAPAAAFAGLTAGPPPSRLPTPTGPYAVGTATYAWTDSARQEAFTPEDSADRRELSVQIWYPASPGSGGRTAPLLPAAGRAAPMLADRLGLPGASAGLIEQIGRSPTHATPDASVADGQARWPVLLYQHGMSGVRMLNTHLMEELASRGYVMVGMDHTYESAVTVFPDGRVVESRVDEPADAEANDRYNDDLVRIRTADARFVLDQLGRLDAGPLAGRLDLDRVGMVGHSMGGATTAEVLRIDPRVRAGINMDGIPRGQVVDSGLDRPFLILQSDRPGSTDASGGAHTERYLGRRDALLEGARAGGWLAVINGARHASFTDLPLLLPPTKELEGVLGPIDPARAHTIMVDYLTAFFARYLDGHPAPLLDGPSPTHPEVRLEVRNARAGS